MALPVFMTSLWCPRGHFNEDQADKYAELCQDVLPRYVLEIGFCTGRSAVSVLYNTENFLQKMISVDSNLDYKAPEGRQMAELLTKRFPKFAVVEMASQKALTPPFFAREFPEGVDWATIDGDHSYDGCLNDLTTVAPFLSERGIMVVDDYRSGPPNGISFTSVTNSVNAFVLNNVRKFEAETWNKGGKGFCVIRRRRRSACPLSPNGAKRSRPSAKDSGVLEFGGATTPCLALTH